MTVSPDTFEVLLPCMIFLWITRVPSSSTGISRSLSIFLCRSFSTPNTSSTSAYSSPVLISEGSAFAPRARFTDPITTDLPAPVSPVKILSPLENSISCSFIRARFFTCKLYNIFPHSVLLLHHFTKLTHNFLSFFFALNSYHNGVVTRNTSDNFFELQ